MIERIDHPERAIGIIASSVGAVDGSRGGLLSERFPGLRRGPGKQVDGFLFHLVEAEGVVVVVADDDVATGVEGEVFGAVELGGGAGSIVAGVAFFAGGIYESVNASFLVDVTESVAFPGGDEDRAVCSVDGGARADQGREGRFFAILGNTAFSVSGDGFHPMRGEIDLENLELAEIRDEEFVVIRMKGDGVGIFELQFSVTEGGELAGIEIDDTDS